MPSSVLITKKLKELKKWKRNNKSHILQTKIYWERKIYDQFIIIIKCKYGHNNEKMWNMPD